MIDAILIDRVLSSFEITDGCWPWVGHITDEGYGDVKRLDRAYRAHRLVYELVRGPIDIGMVPDHLCRNRACVRPSHIEPVTRGTNTLRGVGPTAQHARATHCVNGHPFDDANTYVWQAPRGTARACRTCNRAAVARRKERLKGEVIA